MKPKIRRRLRALPVALIAAISSGPAAEARTRLIHAEDFSVETKLDPAFWIAETGFFRNKEAQYYRPANVGVRNGLLVLEAKAEPALNAAYDPGGADWLTTTRAADYTSGSIVSRDAFSYGMFEVVARLPQSAGTWPAIWMVYEQGLPYREIDLVEAVGNDPDKVWSTIHAGPDKGSLKYWQSKQPMPGLAGAFHVYRLEWRKDAISIAIDGRERLRLDPNLARDGGADPLRAPMHLRINLALGGSWGGKIDPSALPARIEVKSIKVWSEAP